MTLQWTAVAIFLYVEIAVILILCLPFISAQRWRSVFNLGIWNWISPYWNRFFFAMIFVLIILFFDALREVQKYSATPMQDAKLNPGLFDHMHMKLFRAQRNLYISGFSLFLWLIMRRVVTLLNLLAISTDAGTGLLAQADGANQAAKKYQEDNLRLRQALLDEEKSTSVTNQQVKKEAEKLAGELKTAQDAVRTSQAEVEAMKRQAKGLTLEYDRLMREHQQLQSLQNDVVDKKDL